MNVLVLRGMQVLPKFQNQGIGTELLKSCDSYLAGKSCYCLPWKHLHSFYERAGFKPILPEQLPVFLNLRFQRYIANKMNVISMYRPSGK